MKYFLATYEILAGEHEHKGAVIIEDETAEEAYKMAEMEEYTPEVSCERSGARGAHLERPGTRPPWLPTREAAGRHRAAFLVQPSAQEARAGCIQPCLWRQLPPACPPWTSFRTLSGTYAMMEWRKRTEAKHLAGRGQDGLCRGGGSSDCPPAPAGPPDLRHPQATVPA